MNALQRESDTNAVTHFGTAASWTGVSDSDRESWLNMRMSMITASDVGAIMGENPYRDAFDVYTDKVLPPPEQDLGLDSPMFWGKVLEMPIAHAVAKKKGWQIREGGHLLRSRKHPIIGATLDAEILRSQEEGWIVYEGKTSRIDRDWDESKGTLPTHILVQAQVQLLVTDAPRNVVFGLLQGSRPSMVVVEAYAEFHSIVLEQCEWMMDLVKRGEPPTPTDKSLGSIQRMYPTSDGSTVALAIEAVEQTREIQEIAAKMKELTARKTELSNMIRLSIGEHSYGELGETVGGKGAWKYGISKGGQRPLIQVKRAPGKAVPALEAPTLLRALPEADLIEKYGTKRRRARR